jgi:HPt (histidine-containing phosphotransfer) domain-containing protein
MDDYLTKPIDLDIMCKMVDKWTRMDEAGREVVARAQADQINPPMPERLAKVVPMKQEEPVIDEARLEVSSMGSEELKGILMNAFMKNARPRLTKLRDHATRGDTDGVEFEAHALKGMCATLGADRCAKLFEKIEHLARDGGVESLPVLIQAADKEVKRVEAAIEPRMKAA